MQQNKYHIKIPQDIFIIFSKKTETLTVIGPLAKKSIKLKLKVTLNESTKILSVSPLPFSSISNAEKKQIKALRNTTIAQIKHLFIESSTTIFQKLNIIGVGYRVDLNETSKKNLITLKLGYSHYFYTKIPKNLTVKCLTKTKLSIFGNSYNDIYQLAAAIRSKKTPEPYKGKGILFENETVVLKEGKKI